MTPAPTIYQVKPEQVGKEDLSTFLRRAISKQFDGKEYYIAKESIEEKPTPYSTTPRKLRIFAINENNSVGHVIYFDVTECENGINWLSR
jgi:hypothetical protein